MRRFRVVVKNKEEPRVQVVTKWLSWQECRGYVKARWGGWPRNVVISQIKDVGKLRRKVLGRGPMAGILRSLRSS